MLLTTPRILRRAEVASRLGCSLRTVDHWAGCKLLSKVRLPGRVRCAGFRESDICALIADGLPDAGMTNHGWEAGTKAPVRDRREGMTRTERGPRMGRE